MALSVGRDGESRSIFEDFGGIGKREGGQRSNLPIFKDRPTRGKVPSE